MHVKIIMGRAYTYRCSHCGFQSRFKEGHGYLIRRQPLQLYLRGSKVVFHHKTYRVLRYLATKSDTLTVDAGFKVYKCPMCHLLHEKVEVKVLDEDVLLHTSEFRCRRCRARLKLTNIHRLKKAVCPSCRNESFSISRRQTELWTSH